MRSIQFRNFKCFKKVSIPLAPLTLLTGANGTGKSTVIQALMLLRQNERGEGIIDELELFGVLTSVGTAEHVLNGFAEDELIEICVDESKWVFRVDSLSDKILPGVSYPRPVPRIPLFSPEVIYLCARRMRPFLHYDAISSVYTEMHKDGSHTWHWYHERQEQEVQPALRHPDATSPRLREQAQRWLGEISPGTRFSVSLARKGETIKLFFEFESAGVGAKKYQPSDSNFSLFYALPVMLACLSAAPGRLLVIENPEAHLDPRSQMLMGDLLARATAAGAQVIVETHSDHVLNGVRLAVKEAKLGTDQVAVHFFSRRVAEGEVIHECHSPKIDQSGRLSEWPEGFFDQHEIALARLL
jgi:predicted ATPase